MWFGWHAHPTTLSSHTHRHTHCGFAHRHTTTPSCVSLQSRAMCAWSTTPHSPMPWSSRFLRQCVPSTPFPSTVCACVCVCGGLVVGVCWCGHLCEWLSGGWLCWLHHTVCRVCLHTLTRLCLHSLTGGGWVVDGGPGGGLAGRTVGGVDTCGQGGWHSGTVSLTPLCLSTPCGPSPNSSFLSLLCVWWLSG